ncbi:MAG: bifunctional hydroxymethylpyrimidine kinase/phosphomethylpyrimidine kinase [Acidobacteria bacterium]|nr:bifunctional hydroxymethylpyrimidine kinase/phosphomethylpyrimidine kinase [Acidobacteriota bacterium]
MGILVVGSVVLDSVKTPFGIREEILGGSATYFSVAASYFTDVSIVAVVGTDFPEEHISFLQSKGVNISGLERQKGRTFRWKGEYGLNLNTCTTLDTQLNVFAGFSPKLLSPHRTQDYLFLANIDPDLQRSVLEQVRRPKLIACDTMNYWIENTRESLLKTLSKIDLLIINDAEAQQLSGESNITRAARNILSLGPSVVVIKRGEYGALMFNSKSVFSVPALPMEEVLDPTGAGDSFAGGLVGYLAATNSTDEASMRRAVVYGSVMASFDVMDFGPQRLGTLTYPEIESRYREFHRLAFFEDIVKNRFQGEEPL